MRLNEIKNIIRVNYLFTVILLAFVFICGFNRIEPFLYFRPRLWVLNWGAEFFAPFFFLPRPRNSPVCLYIDSGKQRVVRSKK